jgi:hypothetical protein
MRPRKLGSRDEYAMYLVVEGQPCPVAVSCLKRAEVHVGQKCEDVENKFVI